MSSLEIQVAMRPSGGRVITLRGPVILETVFDLQNTLRQEHTDLIVELSGVPYMDSAGLGAILTAYASCQRNHRKFALAGVSSRIMVLLEVTKVNTLVPIFNTVADAEGASAAKA